MDSKNEENTADGGGCRGQAPWQTRRAEDTNDCRFHRAKTIPSARAPSEGTLRTIGFRVGSSLGQWRQIASTSGTVSFQLELVMVKSLNYFLVSTQCSKSAVVLGYDVEQCKCNWRCGDSTCRWCASLWERRQAVQSWQVGKRALVASSDVHRHFPLSLAARHALLCLSWCWSRPLCVWTTRNGCAMVTSRRRVWYVCLTYLASVRLHLPMRFFISLARAVVCHLDMFCEC